MLPGVVRLLLVTACGGIPSVRLKLAWGSAWEGADVVRGSRVDAGDGVVRVLGDARVGYLRATCPATLVGFDVPAPIVECISMVNRRRFLRLQL